VRNDHLAKRRVLRKIEFHSGRGARSSVTIDFLPVPHPVEHHIPPDDIVPHPVDPHPQAPLTGAPSLELFDDRRKTEGIRFELRKGREYPPLVS